jgi:phytoene desaturase
MPKQKTAAIIGGGIGGLAVANILAEAGMKVSVYESRPQLGGRAGLKKAKGFTFDTGPSWYLMPEVYEQYYSLFGHTAADFFELKRLDPGYQVYFGDSKNRAIITADYQANRAVFETLQPESSSQFDTYVSRSKLAYQVSLEHFLYNPFISFMTLVNAGVLKHIPSLLKLTTRSLHSYVNQYFSAPEAQQLLEYPSVFLGASPYMAPALFSLMSYLDFSQGVYYPMGGMYGIVESLRSIGAQRGVTYHLNKPIEAINVAKGKVQGVTLTDGEQVAADLIVSNADLHYTETKLLPEDARSYPEKYWQKKQAGPSALLIYLGIKGRLPQLEHHNLLFIKDWESNFDDTFKTKKWSNPASLYVCMPSATDANVAPKGSENIFILIPGPAGQKLDTAALSKLANRYVDQFARTIHEPDLRSRIVFQENFGPNEFETEYMAWQATALGPAHTLRQSAFFRPSNRSKKVKNLYYVGAGTQPGIGVPLCLISAELVYKHIVHDASAGPLIHINPIGDTDV